jgi:seryl-tRNA synthetase
MIDLIQLRKNKEEVQRRIAKKDPSFDSERLYDLDTTVRHLKSQVESLREQKNHLASQAKSGVTEAIRTQSIEIGRQLKEQEKELEQVEKIFMDLYLSCPNLPADDIPEGNKESNKVVKVVGQKPEFDFEVKNHVELGEALGWFDFQAAARIAGSNFAMYKKDGVRMIYALTMLMLKNNIRHGFEPILPSALVNEKTLETSGNFPKFRDQVYTMPADNLFLAPTSEVNLASLYAHTILDYDQLPVRMTAWTSCFRREAGNYGALERGLIRIHQFEKVELYSICEPEKSNAELDSMIACAETILQKLGLHYRISLLAGQDCSFQSAKTYDIEVWLPGQKQYYEVSSASNCTDFQARRGLIRYRVPGAEKASLVHTLNASSLAIPRLMVAIMETYQQADGSIAIPDVLLSEGIFGV